MIDEILEDAKDRMEKAVEHVQNEFGTVRTGRANPSILHRVTVDYYGSPTPLQQLASFAVPEPTTLVVSPFDPGALGEIERAITASGLGLNPANDGTVIRLTFPPLTEERRKELVKVVNHMAEEGKVAIRNIRRPHKDDLEALKGELSEDDIRRAEKELQNLTDTHVDRIDELFEHKQAELLEV
ncbi:MAG: ribosome recycling factor [Gemmatimonadetes bacterium]|nr:ribosome recycling factor [Acidimicrobiia bacterium]MBT8488141.1 ribosome recycling factor [Gemmatimonadota bacterium]NNF10135.1 ribosome recycling factor [Acidimicrobiia bacterium]NNL71656.1 ribosome recycling factor [Acidimicrobiia bacterium]